MRFIKEARVNASAEAVWNVFAHDFDHAYKWMAGVRHSYAKTNGELFGGAQSAGRVCELRPEPTGLKASEKFLAYDEAAKTCTVRIEFVDAPAMFPVRHNTLEFSVVEVGEGQSKMTWVFSSKTKPWAFFMWPMLRMGSGVFVGQIIEELTHYVETGSPHPRKIEAMNKAKLAAGT